MFLDVVPWCISPSSKLNLPFLHWLPKKNIVKNTVIHILKKKPKQQKTCLLWHEGSQNCHTIVTLKPIFYDFFLKVGTYRYNLPRAIVKRQREEKNKEVINHFFYSTLKCRSFFCAGAVVLCAYIVTQTGRPSIKMVIELVDYTK